MVLRKGGRKMVLRKGKKDGIEEGRNIKEGRKMVLYRVMVPREDGIV